MKRAAIAVVAMCWPAGLLAAWAQQPMAPEAGSAVGAVAATARDARTAGRQLDAKADDGPVAAGMSPAVEQLRAFRESEVKFKLDDLMDVLSDRRHEGWVLAAYPDPKTRQPLIGAGVSLDLPARMHVQRDPLNPHPFLEPSSAEIWQAAGLGSAKLETILAEFRRQSPTWTRHNRRMKLAALTPQITNRDATALLRMAAVQSVLNARAYCRNFDQLSASQQMALSQLVFQMGVNLEEFSQFLGVINSGVVSGGRSAAGGHPGQERGSGDCAGGRSGAGGERTGLAGGAAVAGIEPVGASLPDAGGGGDCDVESAIRGESRDGGAADWGGTASSGSTSGKGAGGAGADGVECEPAWGVNQAGGRTDRTEKTAGVDGAEKPESGRLSG